MAKRRSSKRTTKPNILGKPSDVKLRTLRVSSLNIADGSDRETNYQRVHDPKFGGWDWGKYDPIRVSERPDGSLWVEDGGGRVRRAKALDIRSLPSLVHRRNGPKEEAAAFMHAADSKRTITAVDRYHASLTMGDKWAVDIKNVLDKFGLQIAATSGGRSWPNIGTVDGLRKQTVAGLLFACKTITSVPSWNGDADSLRDECLCGLASAQNQVFGLMGSRFDHAKFYEKLNAVVPMTFLARCNQAKYTFVSRRKVATIEFVSIYSKRAGSKLAGEIT